MADLVPSDKKFDRAALERIIRRAAELQARDHEIGEELDERQLLALGREVGIPGRFLQQAVLEEQGRTGVSQQGVLASLMGATAVSAQRTVTGECTELEELLMHWMTQEELLIVKRRYTDKTSWEPRSDVMASLKRALEFGGRKYALTRAREVLGQVVALEDGWCHVRLIADLTNSYRSYAGGAAGLAAVSGAAGGVGFLAGVALPLALVPIPIGLIGGWLLARSRRSEVERAQVALEQILDRLERGEIKRPESSPAGGPLSKLADEIRRGISAELGHSGRPGHRRIPDRTRGRGPAGPRPPTTED